MVRQALPDAGESEFSEEDWHQIAEVKDAVNKVLETQRANGVIGGALGAEVTLFADDDLRAVLQKLGDELRFVLITSKATLKPLSEAGDARSTDVDGLKVAVAASEHAKCGRCWRLLPEVPEDGALCRRCDETVAQLDAAS